MQLQFQPVTLPNTSFGAEQNCNLQPQIQMLPRIQAQRPTRRTPTSHPIEEIINFYLQELPRTSSPLHETVLFPLPWPNTWRVDICCWYSM